jgi:drug/metabolite transporter (DMT)-like permease
VKKQILAHVSLALAMIIAGSSVVAGKLIVAKIPVFLAAGIRFGIASIFLLPLAIRRERPTAHPGRRGWLFLFLQAFCGAFLFTICLFLGLSRTGATEAGLITSTTPAMIAVLSVLFLHESLDHAKAAGVTLAVCGILMSTAGATTGTSAWIGNLLIFGAVIGEALFTIFRKALPASISPLFTAVSMCLFSFLLFMPLAIPQTLGFDFSSLTLQDWGLLFYYGIVVSGIGFMLWFTGVSNTEATTAAVYTGLMPVSAILFSCLILHETIHLRHVAGMLAILCGLGLMIRNTLSNRGDMTDVEPV